MNIRRKVEVSASHLMAKAYKVIVHILETTISSIYS